MSTGRKTVVLFLLGLILGVGLGVGALQLRKRGIVVPFLPATPPPSINDEPLPSKLPPAPTLPPF